jgi:hypothetical protein
VSTVVAGRTFEIATNGAEVWTGSTETTVATVFDSVTGAGFELRILQQDPGASDAFIAVPSWPIFILAIIGHSGGHCMDELPSGTHIAIDRNGSNTIAARTLVETNLCQKRMLYVYSSVRRLAVIEVTTMLASSKSITQFKVSQYCRFSRGGSGFPPRCRTSNRCSTYFVGPSAG